MWLKRKLEVNFKLFPVLCNIFDSCWSWKLTQLHKITLKKKLAEPIILSHGALFQLKNWWSYQFSKVPYPLIWDILRFRKKKRWERVNSGYIPRLGCASSSTDLNVPWDSLLRNTHQRIGHLREINTSLFSIGETWYNFSFTIFKFECQHYVPISRL